MRYLFSLLPVSLFVRSVLCLLLLNSMMLTALANDFTWVGGTPGSPNDWGTPSNWNPSNNDVPGVNANLPPDTVTLNPNVLTKNIQVNPGYWGFFGIYGWNINDAYTLTIGNVTFDNSIPFFNYGTNGSLTIINNGLLRFHYPSLTGKATITNNSSGVIQFSDDANAGYINFTNYGQMTFTEDFPGQTSSAGHSIIMNDNSNALLEFLKESTAGQATITNTNGATINFRDSSNAGQATITNTNGASLHFYDNSNAAQATIINLGSSLDFSGLNLNTPFSIGSLSNTSDALLSLGSTELSLGAKGNNDSIGGVISGGSSSKLIKIGGGTLTLNGVNTYSGTTAVTNGNLVVGDVLNPSASIASSNEISVGPILPATSAILSGFGTVGDLTLNNLGIVAPGSANDIGTLTVNGNFTAESGSVFTVKIDDLNNDKLNINGDATLNGGTVSILLSGRPQVGETYTLLTASGDINGTFSNVTPLVFTLTGGLNYSSDPHRVLYTVEVAPFVEDVISSYANQLPALSQAFTWFDSQFQERILGYASGQNIYYNPYATHTPVDDPTIWLTTNTIDARLSEADSGFKGSSRNVALGIEKSADDLLLGIGLAYTDFHSSGFSNDTQASVKAALYQAGIYARLDYWDWRLGVAANAGTTHALDTEAFYHQGVTPVTSTADRGHAYKLGTQVEAAYTGLQVNSHVKIQPLLALSYQFVARDKFIPKDNAQQQLGLTLDHSSNLSIHSQLGATLEANLDTYANVHPFAFMAWEHEFADDRNDGSAQLTSTSEALQVQSAAIGREALATKLGISFTQHKVWNFATFYEGHLAKHYCESAAKIAVNYSF